MAPTPTYETRDGEPVPEAVAETFDDPEAWTEYDPTDVRTYQEGHWVVYQGEVDGDRQLVTEEGRATYEADYTFTERRSADGLPCEYATVTYNDDMQAVHADHFVEHVTRVIVVTAPETRTVFGSRSGVVWPESHMDMGSPDFSRDVLNIAGALSDASNTVEPPEEIQEATSGWHISHEQSEQSDMMNALAKGDVDYAWMDEGDIFPYVVRYGDSRNVCSANASIYGNAHFRACVRDAFEGSRAEPAFGGFA